MCMMKHLGDSEEAVWRKRVWAVSKAGQGEGNGD